MDLGQRYGATELGGEPTVALEKSLLAREVSREGAPAQEVKEDVVGPEGGSRFPVFALDAST